MEKEILMDGHPLKVGDRVYSILHGIVDIFDIDHHPKYPIKARNEDKNTYAFSRDFKYDLSNCNRVLYWQKPDFSPPPKPKQKKKVKVKVWDWFVLFYSGNIDKQTEKQKKE